MGPANVLIIKQQICKIVVTKLDYIRNYTYLYYVIKRQVNYGNTHHNLRSLINLWSIPYRVCID